jgi:hypothetical protein
MLGGAKVKPDLLGVRREEMIGDAKTHWMDAGEHVSILPMAYQNQ